MMMGTPPSAQQLQHHANQTQQMDLNRVTTEERAQRLEAIRLAEELHTLDLQLMVLREEERISRERAELIQAQNIDAIEPEEAIAAITALSEAEQRRQLAENARAAAEDAALLLSTASWWSAPAPSAPLEYPSLAPPPPHQQVDEGVQQVAPPGYGQHLQQQFGQRADDMAMSARNQDDMVEPLLLRASSSQRILQEREERRRSNSANTLPSYESAHAEEAPGGGYPIQVTPCCHCGHAVVLNHPNPRPVTAACHSPLVL